MFNSKNKKSKLHTTLVGFCMLLMVVAVGMGSLSIFGQPQAPAYAINFGGINFNTETGGGDVSTYWSELTSRGDKYAVDFEEKVAYGKIDTFDGQRDSAAYVLNSIKDPSATADDTGGYYFIPARYNSQGVSRLHAGAVNGDGSQMYESSGNGQYYWWWSSIALGGELEEARRAGATISIRIINNFVSDVKTSWSLGTKYYRDGMEFWVNDQKIFNYNAINKSGSSYSRISQTVCTDVTLDKNKSSFGIKYRNISGAGEVSAYSRWLAIGVKVTAKATPTLTTSTDRIDLTYGDDASFTYSSNPASLTKTAAVKAGSTEVLEYSDKVRARKSGVGYITVTTGATYLYSSVAKDITVNVAKRKIEVSLMNTSATYGLLPWDNLNYGFSYGSNGMIGSDTWDNSVKVNPSLILPIGYNTLSNVGTYVFGLGNDNGSFSDKYTYDASGKVGNMLINPAQLVIEYTAKLDKVYDGLAVSQLEQGRDYKLILNGNQLANQNLYGSANISIAWDMIDKINWRNSGYIIGLSVSNVGSNYVVSSNNSPGGQVYNINKAPILVKYDANAITKVYDGNIIGEFLYQYKVGDSGTYKSGGNVQGDELLIPTEKLPKLLWDISNNINAGQYSILFSNFIAPNTNYAISWDGESAKTYTLTQKSLKAKLNNIKGERYGSYSGIPADYFSINYDGFLAGDTATSSLDFEVPTISAPSGFDRLANVGDYNFTLSNGSARNYVFSYESANITISKANLRANLGNKSGKTSVEYGDFSQAGDYFEISYVGFVDASQDANNIGLTSATIVLPNGFNQFSNVGDYTFSVTGGSANNYNIVVGNSANLTITPAKLTSNLVSGLSDKTSSIAYGLYNNIDNHFDIVTTGYKRAADSNNLVSPTIVTPNNLSQFSDRGSYLITLSGGSAANYTITLGSGVNLVITEAIINVTLSSMTKEYDGYSVGAPQYSYTLNGVEVSNLYNSDTWTLGWNIDAVKDCLGGGYTVIFNQTHTDNYLVKFAADYSTYTITKKDLFTYIEDNTITYGSFKTSDLAKIFPIKFEGFVNDENQSAIAQLPIVYATDVVQYSQVGDYAVILEGGNSLNYNIINSDSSILKITAANIVVVRDDNLGYAKAYNGEVVGTMGYHFINPFGSNILLDGDKLGDGQILPTIRWNLDNIKDYANDGYTISVFSNGQPGLSIDSSNYNIAFDSTDPIGQTFVISKAVVTLNYTSSLTKVYDGLTIPAMMYTYKLDGNAIDFGRLYINDTLPIQNWHIDGATDVTDGGYLIQYTPNCSTNYEIDWDTDPTSQKFVITKANLVATIEDISLKYGEYADSSLATYFPISYSGFVNSETAIVISQSPSIVNQSGISQLLVGGDYTFTLSGGAATNYNIEIADSAKMTITKATLSVSLRKNSTNIEYGSYTKPADYWTIDSYSGFFYSEDSSSITTAPSIVSILVMSDRSDVGEYNFGITGGLADNYTFDIQETYILSITPKAISASGLSYIDQIDYDAGRTYLELYNSAANTDKTLSQVMFGDDVYMTVQLDSYQTSPKVGETYTKRTLVGNSYQLKGSKADNYVIANLDNSADQDVSVIGGLDGVIIYGLTLWVYANLNQQYYYSQYIPSDITITVYKAKLKDGILTKTDEIVTNLYDYLKDNMSYLFLEGTLNAKNYLSVGSYVIRHNSDAVKYDENVAISFLNVENLGGEVSAEIVALPITVKDVIVSKVYDGTINLLDSNITNKGTVVATAGKGAPYDISGLGINYTDISLTDKNVITADNIFNYTATITGDEASNYTFTNSIIYGTVTPKDITISVQGGQSKEYDGLTVSSGILYSVSELCNGDDIDNSFSGALDLGGVIDVLRSGDRTVIGIDVKLGTLTSSNYSITAVSGQYIIQPKSVTTIVAENQSKIYDGRTVESGIRYSIRDLIGNDTTAKFSGSLNLGGKINVAVNSNGDAVGIQVEVGTLFANNYYINNVEGTYTIAKRQITVTPFSGQKSYYSTDINIQYRYSGTLAADNNILNDKKLSLANIDADTYTISIGDLETNLSTNYYITLIQESYTIDAMPIGLTGITAAKVYDGTDNIVSSNINIEGARFVYLEGLASSRPVHSGLSFDLDITKIKANSKDVLTLNNTLNLESGAISLTFGDGLSNKNYTLSDSNYPKIALTITKKQVIVVAKSDQSKEYDGKTVTSGILYDIVGVAGGTGLEECDKNNSSAITMLLNINNVKDVTRNSSNTVIGTGIYASNISSANYDIVLDEGKIEGEYIITPKQVGVEVISGQSKVYDKQTVESGILYRIIGVNGGTGLVSGDAIDTDISMNLHLNGAVDVKREGNNVIGYSVYVKDIISNNYQVITGLDNIVNGSFAITPKKVTVIVKSGQSKEYDGTTLVNGGISYIISGYGGGSGLEDGDEIGTAISMSLNIKDKNVMLVDGIVSGQSVYATNVVSNNYETIVGADSVVSGVFTITQRTVSIQATEGQNKIYDNITVNSGIEFSVDRLLDGETIADNFDGALNIGNVTKVNIDGLGNVVPIYVKQGSLAGILNYKIISVSGDYTIFKRKITIIPTSEQSSTYSRTLINNMSFSYLSADDTSGLIAGDSNIYIGKLGVSDVNKSTRGYINVGKHEFVIGTLAPDLGGDGKNYYFELDTSTKYNITPLEITVTNIATYDKMYDATNSNIEFNSSSYWLKPTNEAASINEYLTFNVNAGSATCKDINVASNVRVDTTFSISDGSDLANNYIFVQPTNMTVNILPRIINIVLKEYKGWDIDKIIYSGLALDMTQIVFQGKDTKLAVNRELNQFGLYGEDTIDSVFSGYLALNGETALNADTYNTNKGTLTIISNNYVLADNIFATQNDSSFVIIPRPITISPIVGQSKRYDAKTSSVINFSYENLAEADVAAEFQNTLNINNNVNVGVYDIALGVFLITTNHGITRNNNYVVSLDTNIVQFTINKADIVLTNALRSKVYDGNTAILSGLNANNIKVVSINDAVVTDNTYALLSVTDSLVGNIHIGGKINQGTYSLSASNDLTITTVGYSGSNYSITLCQSEDNIAKISILPLSITLRAAVGQSKTYNSKGITNGIYYEIFNKNGSLLTDETIKNGLLGELHVDQSTAGQQDISIGTLASHFGNFEITIDTTIKYTITKTQIGINIKSGQSKLYDGTISLSGIQADISSGVVYNDDFSINDIIYLLSNKQVGTQNIVLGSQVDAELAANYQIAINGAPTIMVTPRELTLTANADITKVFDKNTKIDLSSSMFSDINFSNICLEDQVEIDFANSIANSTDWHVGIKNLVVKLKLAGLDGANYIIKDITTWTAEVTPKELTVSGMQTKTKVYNSRNDDILVFGGTLVGAMSGDAVSIATFVQGDTTYQGYAITSSANVGEYADAEAKINLTLNVYGDYFVSNVSLSANIVPKTISVEGVEAQNKAFDGNTSIKLLNGRLIGIEVSDLAKVSLSLTNGKAHSSNTGVVQVNYTPSLTGESANNYTIGTSNIVNATINKRKLTIKEPKKITLTKEYDGTTAVDNSSDIVLGDFNNLVEGYSVSINYLVNYDSIFVSDNKIITISYYLDDSNYEAPAPTLLKGSILKRRYVIEDLTLSTLNKIYDGKATYTLNVDGTISKAKVKGQIETISTLLTYQVFFNTKDVNTANKIIVKFALSGISDSNNYLAPIDYEITTGVAITPKTINVSYPSLGEGSLSQEYDGAIKTLNAAANGTIANEDAVLVYKFKLNGIDILPIDVNNYTVETIASNPNYIISVSDKNRNFAITKKNAGNYVLNSKSHIYNGVAPAETIDSHYDSTIIVAISFQYFSDESRTQQISRPTNVGKYFLRVVLSTNNNYQDIAPLEASLEITPRPLSMIYSNYELTYNGNVHYVFASLDRSNVLTNDSLKIVSSNTSNTQAGSYIIQNTIYNTTDNTINNNYYIQNDNFGYTIAKATVSNLSLVGAKVRYNAANYNLLITGSLPEDGQITVSYSGNGQRNVGVYTVTARFATSSNYNAIEDLTATLDIIPKEITVSFSGTQDLIYSGNYNPIFVSVLGAIGDEQYGLVDILEGTAGFVNAGDYTATAILVGENSLNYTIIGEKVETYSIAKATFGSIGFLSEEFVFNGQAHSLRLDKILNDQIKVEYTNNSLVDVGSLLVTATFSILNVGLNGEEVYNYNEIPSASATLKVLPKEVGISFFGYENLVYDGAAKNVTAYYTDVSGTQIQAKINYQDNITEVINANTYKAIASISDANYKIIGLDSRIFVVAKATFSPTFGEGGRLNVTYNGLPQTLAINEKTIPSEIQVSYLDNNQVEVGNYVVIAKFSVSNNFNAINDLSVILNIIPSELTLEYIGNNSLIYNGKLQTVEAQVNGEIFSQGDKLDNIGLVLSNNSYINAGNYLLTASITNKNYTITNPRLDFSIAKANVNGFNFESKTITFDGEGHSLLVSGTLPRDVEVKYSNNYKTNVLYDSKGRVAAHQVTASFVVTSNYNAIAPITASLTINPLAVEVNFDGYQGLIYNGHVHSLGAYYDNIIGVSQNAVVTYSDRPYNAGKYLATATIEDGNYIIKGANTQAFEIEKITAEITFLTKDQYIYNTDRQTISYKLDKVLDKDKVSATLIYNQGQGHMLNAGLYVVTATINNSNYNLVRNNSVPTISVLVEQRKLTIGVENLSITEGETPTYKFVYGTNEDDSFLGQDNPDNALTSKPIIDNQFLTSGLYTIMPTGAYGRNYKISYTGGTILVNAKILVKDDVTVDGSFKPKTELTVIELGKDIINNLAPQTIKGYSVEKLYDIQLYQEGVSVQPDSTIKIRLKVENIVVSSGYYRILHIKSDGTSTLITDVRVVDNQYLEFETDSLSQFAILTTPNYSFVTVIVLGLAGLLLVGLLVAMLRRKY